MSGDAGGDVVQLFPFLRKNLDPPRNPVPDWMGRALITELKLHGLTEADALKALGSHEILNRMVRIAKESVRLPK